ncbi:MAG: hypothetical protein EP332_11225 [Bacteroidetes bacterium]|nr:MAG: hypothetical protein EP332_11225 [Bacteroidota bacterium]
MDKIRAYLRQPVNWIIPLIILSALYYPFIKWLLCLHETIEVIQAYGIFAAVISGLAFIAFLDATRLQRIQLEKQAEEIQLQRDDLKIQHELLEQTIQESREQNRTIALQRFENTFFNLLRNVHTGLEYVQYFEGKVGSRGKLCFVKVYEKQNKTWWNLVKSELNLSEEQLQLERLGNFKIYNENFKYLLNNYLIHLKKSFFNQNQSYFDTIIATIILVKNNQSLLKSDVNIYLQFISAQLTIYEKWALFLYLEIENHHSKSTIFGMNFFEHLQDLHFADARILHDILTFKHSEEINNLDFLT